jgi:hypothetical protein
MQLILVTDSIDSVLSTSGFTTAIHITFSICLVFCKCFINFKANELKISRQKVIITGIITFKQISEMSQ